MSFNIFGMLLVMGVSSFKNFHAIILYILSITSFASAFRWRLGRGGGFGLGVDDCWVLLLMRPAGSERDGLHLPRKTKVRRLDLQRPE